MMGLIGAGNNPMVGMTVAIAVSIEEAAKAGKCWRIPKVTLTRLLRG